MADLKAAEVEKAREHFEIYDWEGEGKIDARDLGDLLRSLDCKPTLAMVKKNGGSDKRGEKKLTLEEFLPIFSQIKKEKEVGTLEDFMEGLKVYDKAENGTMLAAELAHVLLSLGERLTDIECEEIMRVCDEDDDGFLKYEPFVKTIIAGPFPDEGK
uniref:Myosin alkali light chain 1 n=2 Tax=Aphonopelma TaxID=6896 RepID=A0A109ZW43_9ARAC|nr:Chain C, MYOSIN 2 ESSENTIAL LIGHT CHAIN STRIATED MUSCLE [Aphonopelma]3JBH_D Chain D, MYOSIN 2 ESSENTIAL LIGHT CHAIN STRIATED MUSCLE [Aphonopelma]3JBH_I Chain I, MYOSIN 2 ESSENTIAL LIGHT CHAIN STRIATED MUSCLE [Aphonopelma]3JBH_J Chain J, MYOSIN 2 ESSENTIAL LIGHT CHAIN STRIATED MUSCLE [Aphonopelma]6SO3_C Chain C, Myosin 2 essential light chain striated muscle [Lethocerus indicus]6SO3_D Chain D, Myosin 2 essential light chain striated muscle [Lethocerus indicus]AMB19042.1 myosin alkali light 